MQDASVFTAYLDKYSRLQASKYQVKLFQLPLSDKGNKSVEAMTMPAT